MLQFVSSLLCCTAQRHGGHRTTASGQSARAHNGRLPMKRTGGWGLGTGAGVSPSHKKGGGGLP